ncbi:hypothetical protein PCANC_25089 [Puccinia coronata f. sp. avenae]|uniref:Uncharacterized protein n=1 Tax=Puccinia coronata f. sp. avenae TaxID=200324 RepID=A0A2N5TAN1_9BASI|nr:hypothetical protein PCANC_25089 [Puccinia coronata f. sp. avenae]
MQPRPGGYSCPANPNQVTLEVEREGYVFELYLPASHSMGPLNPVPSPISLPLALHFPHTTTPPI